MSVHRKDVSAMRADVPSAWIRGGKMILAGELVIVVVPCPPARGWLPAATCVRKHGEGKFDGCQDCTLGPERGARSTWKAAKQDVDEARRAGLRFSPRAHKTASPAAKQAAEAQAAKRRATVAVPRPRGKGVRAHVPGGGEWLHRERKRAGLTLVQVAAALGWRPTGMPQLCNIEKGRVPLTVGMRDRLARVFGVAP